MGDWCLCINMAMVFNLTLCSSRELILIDLLQYHPSYRSLLCYSIWCCSFLLLLLQLKNERRDWPIPIHLLPVPSLHSSTFLLLCCSPFARRTCAFVRANGVVVIRETNIRFFTGVYLLVIRTISIQMHSVYTLAHAHTHFNLRG